MDEVSWRGDGVKTCLLCGSELKGRRFNCEPCDSKITETMATDIERLLEEEAH
jgi:hypothetical protein